MKLSRNWLAELVDLDDIDIATLERLLTFHVCEIEEVEEVGAGLDAVIVAEVTSVEPHPDADRLRVCRIDTGGADVGDVVCGAPNVAVGQRIAYAPVGATLPGGESGPLTLEERKIRGVLSHGMICAEDELGLGDDHDGILVLPAEAPLGAKVAEVLGVHDHLIDIANVCITHRPDLWGHVGFAREIAALLRRPLKAPSIEKGQAALDGAEGEPVPVTITDTQGCSRYIGVRLDGLTNGPSPLWLKYRLERLGVRSIDRLVDMTNHVLLEQGQPLHAFDWRAVRGGRIDVRAAKPGEPFKRLDDVTTSLSEQDLIIADGEGPVALAGVMGGASSGVGADTTEILLEAATFDAVRIRTGAQRAGLRTEASSRFEKTLDPHLPAMAAARFVTLALEACPETRVVTPASDVWPEPPEPVVIKMPYSLVRRRLGTRLPDSRIKSRLDALGFQPKEGVRGGLTVTVPTWRASKDVHDAIDLVEEVGRLEGYGKIKPLAPVASLRPIRIPERRAWLRRAGAVLSLDRGYHEVTHYAFYGAADASKAGIDGLAHRMLENPVTRENDRMALTTVVNLLRTASKNTVREKRARFYEQTRLFPAGVDGSQPSRDASEVRVVGLLAYDVGDTDGKPGALVRSLMDDVRAVLQRTGVRDLVVEDAKADALADGLPEPSWLHPGRLATLRSGDMVLGVCGEVAPAVRRAYDIEGRVACAELHLDRIVDATRNAPSDYRPIQRYPVVPFDVSLLVPRKTPAEEVGEVIASVAPEHVRDVRAFDEYEGEGVPQGQRSLAFSCELFDAGATLSTKRAGVLRKKIVKALEGKGWSVRQA